jgi:hypothetical protein
MISSTYKEDQTPRLSEMSSEESDKNHVKSDRSYLIWRKRYLIYESVFIWFTGAKQLTVPPLAARRHALFCRACQLQTLDLAIHTR